MLTNKQDKDKAMMLYNILFFFQTKLMMTTYMDGTKHCTPCSTLEAFASITQHHLVHCVCKSP